MLCQEVPQRQVIHDILLLEWRNQHMAWDLQVGSEDWNDPAIRRQRIRWTQNSKNGPFVETKQHKATDEMEEIQMERNTKEDLHCTPSMQTIYKSLLGQKKAAK